MPIHFYVLSDQGITPEESKVEAIVNAKTPKDATEIRSFLGLATYCLHYIPNFEMIPEPFRSLTQKDTPFIWTEKQETGFKTLKEKLSSAPVLAHFNQKAHAQVIADASPVGLGAVLVQSKRDMSYRPVYYIARVLTKCGCRYSQTEKEALAFVWTCERFRLYLIGMHLL